MCKVCELSAQGTEALQQYMIEQGRRFKDGSPSNAEGLFLATSCYQLAKEDRPMDLIATFVILEPFTVTDIIKLNTWADHDIYRGAQLLNALDISIEQLISKTVHERTVEVIPLLVEQSLGELH